VEAAMEGVEGVQEVEGVMEGVAVEIKQHC
jgi:hypothetical protein